MAEPHDGGGYLVDVSADSSKQPAYVLTTCPICGTELFDSVDECRYTHPERIAAHIATHSPDDLDLDGEYVAKPIAGIPIRNEVQEGR